MSYYSLVYRYVVSGVIAIATLALTACQSSPPVSTNPTPPQVTASPSPTASLPSSTTDSAPSDSKTEPSSTSDSLVIRTAAPYPRRTFELADIARPGSSFYEFRESLQRAVNEHHAEYVRAIAAPNIHLSFGRGMSLEDLDLDNPDSLFWKRLERIINAPCGPRAGSTTDAVGNPEEWGCPAITEIQQLDSGSYDPYTDVFIIGEAINVRMAPSPDSAVIGTLSNEVVKSDSQGFEQLTENQRSLLETNEGWRPIITPDGKRGFVSSRYAFSPIGYRAFFKNEGQGWYMTVFIAGD